MTLLRVWLLGCTQNSLAAAWQAQRAGSPRQLHQQLSPSAAGPFLSSLSRAGTDEECVFWRPPRSPSRARCNAVPANVEFERPRQSLAQIHGWNVTQIGPRTPDIG